MSNVCSAPCSITFTRDDTFGHWLAGFFSGEGYFSIRCDPPRGGRKVTTYTCVVGISLRADDLPILEEIRQWTGIGTIHIAQHGKSKNPSARWQVQRKEDCQILMAIFDRYPLRAKKGSDFALWRCAVAFWASIHGKGTDWSEMGSLRTRLRESHGYGQLNVA